MEQRVSVITLGVADLERSRRFYEDGLGWRRGNDSPGVVFFQIPGAVFALWSRTALAKDAGCHRHGVRADLAQRRCRSKDRQCARVEGERECEHAGHDRGVGGGGARADLAKPPGGGRLPVAARRLGLTSSAATPTR